MQNAERSDCACSNELLDRRVGRAGGGRVALAQRQRAAEQYGHSRGERGQLGAEPPDDRRFLQRYLLVPAQQVLLHGHRELGLPLHLPAQTYPPLQYNFSIFSNSFRFHLSFPFSFYFSILLFISLLFFSSSSYISVLSLYYRFASRA